MGAWFTRHLQVCISSLGKLAATPLATLMTILVIAITLALPALLHLVVRNGLEITGGWAPATDLSVYLTPGTSDDASNALSQLLRARADIQSVTVITPEEAMQSLRAAGDFDAALDAFEENPLGFTLVVTPLPTLSEPAIALLQQELAGLPEADLVQYDTEWVATLQAILGLVRRATWIVAVLLGIGLLVVVGNTIRLDIQNRRDEIEIMQLLGASAAFIRRPFLYTGLWYGLGGGIFAIGVLVAVLLALRGPLDALAGHYGGGWPLSGITWQEAGILVGTGVLIGLVGSWIATARHMRAIDPK